ncbi:hypothetical protein BDV24DRAFT_178706 [Aspergillus arachidicola]|uniref:Major facilitator superfamily (MFS) profile domain-containing protein n=1 Tax=Aspergillus arachidicola TaxID=656916 RepID=A0A5N6YJ52_9EURO|nr:hypothetical protein BDV24DRAFT_178706 [Aspergillus arachidicola]
MDDSKVKSEGDTPPGDLMSHVEQRLSDDHGTSEKGHVEHINLNKNTSAKIKNPLADLTPAQVLQDVEHFANEHGLRDILDHLKKGALIARDPDNFETVENMTDDDITVIARETTHKWRQPWPLYFTIGLCSIGAAVQGWDQTGSNGANLSFPDALGIPEKGALKARNQWLVGILNSAPYLATAFGGCWVSDPLNKYLGRRGVIFISAIFCLLTPIGSAVAQTWPQLFVTRLLMGIGMGLKGATIPIYCAENTPANIRGGLVMSWQLWTAFGIFLGTSANLAVKDTGAISWRLQLGSAFIPALPLTLGVFLCPESPRWYLKKGQVRKAYQSLCKLRNSNLQAARDLYYIYTQIKIEEELVGKHNFLVRLGELFTIPRVRRATLASWTVMLAQQMCGINIVAFYSSTIFAQAGANVTEALLASWGFGLINFLFAFPAVFTIDTYGRRALLLFTFPQMAWTLLAAGFSFYIPQGQTAHLACISLFVFMFAAFYSVGEGPVPFAYSAEVFPLSHREVGMSFAVATNLFWAAVLGITFPRMLAVMSPTGAFAFYAGLNVTACIMIFFLVPETKQRTLEELDYVFAVPVRMHSGYQLKKALPYGVKRYIFRRNVKLDPLYQFDHVATRT